MYIYIEKNKIAKNFVTEEIIEELKRSLKYKTWNYISLYLETKGYELIGMKYFIEYKNNNNIIDIFWDTADKNEISIRINDEKIITISNR